MCFTSWLIGIHSISCEINKFYGVSDRDWKCAHIYFSLHIHYQSYWVIWIDFMKLKRSWKECCACICVFFYFNFNCSMFPLHSYPEHSTFKAEDKQYLVFNKHLYGIQLYLGIQQVVSWLYCTQSCVCLCLRYADSTDTLAFFLFFIKALKTSKHHKTR